MKSPNNLRSVIAFGAAPLTGIALFVALPNPALAQVYGHATHSSPIALSQDNRLIWVVNPSDDSVSVLRPEPYQVLAKIAVGDEPQSVAVTPDGLYAYVANAAGNSVTVIKINNPAWGAFSAVVEGQLTTGAEPWNIVVSPDGERVFVANSAQDTISVIDTSTRSILGQVDLRDSLANDPDRNRHFQPRGLAVTADSSMLYVTRFLSFTKAGGRQGDDLGKEGLVAVLNIDTGLTNISAYAPVRTIALAPQITGFKFPGLTNPPAPDTFAFPNQLQSVVIRGDRAYLPNIAASPTGPLRFNLDTHAFVNVVGGVNSTTPTDLGVLNLQLGARDPEAGKRRLFFANVWAMDFTSWSGAGSAYVVSAASDLLVKLNVAEDGTLSFTGDADTTRYIDLNDPANPATAGVNAGKNPQGIAITDDGTRAYVANFVSRNVSVVDLTTDTVIAVVSTSDLPASGSVGETNLVGAEMFFSSRGNFDSIPGTNSLRDRLSSEGWQSCASCHFKGLTDGVIWQFAAGPRKSVPLNGSFNPHQRSEQRVLNYSAIFDEIEDFEINIRNVSGPGPLVGGALDPNHGLLIGDNGDLNVAPSVLNAFARANADRAQVTVTLSGSTNKVPALTALREWVRNAVRTPNAPLLGLPNGPGTTELAQGRALFAQAGCAQCHGGGNWTVSLKDFISPPVAGELFTERTGTFTGNPVGAQYLNRFLRDIGSFNLGVPGQGNELGNNIGADEKAAAAVTGGALQPAQDALGIDYNNDGKGAGFNVPSLLGLQALPPYLHNGAAETLAAVLADVKHRTDNGRLPDRLSNAADQALVVKFLESVDVATVPVQPLGERPTQSSPIAINATDRLIWAVNPADDSVSVIRPDNNTRLAKIGVGDEPQSVALTPDNQYAYVANAAGNSVTVIKINDPAWGTFSATVEGQLSTGAEPWNVVCTPDGRRVFVANSGQDTITVIDTATRTILGQVDLRNSLANDPDRGRHFQPRGLAVTADSSKLYVTRFLSFTKAGGRQGDDLGKEGLVAVLNIDTGSTNMSAYAPVRTIALAPQITGFKFPGLTNPPAPDTFAFPNQLQSVVIRGESAYVPNVAASPTGPLRFNLDTHAFVNVIGGVNSSSPVDFGALNLHLGARNPEAGKRRVFFANPWAIGFNNQVGEGFAYVASAASDLLVKVKVGADGRLDFTVDADTTRYIDLNDADNPATAGTNAGKNPQGIAVTSDGTRAYVANFVSRNVSVVDLTTDTVMAVVSTSDLPASGSVGETNLVGAEMFFSSRGNFDSIPGTNSLRDRLSSEGWQSCASCHFKGLTDGVIWQFAAGPRKSVPLNGSFNPHQRSEQRVLNYSAIFDEIEDFEINIRNVSGPGPLAGGALDPNHGLLIGDNGDLNVAPSVLNAFARANADRAQVTVTLSGSTNKVPALTALREWVRNAVRTPNAPVAGLPNGPGTTELAQGRALFAQAGCAQCHGGGNWTVSLKDFISPPAAGELFTERTGTFTGNPVGAQYLNRFLRDIGSFNLGVPGQGNELGNNIGADEKAAAAVTGGALQPAQDALGIDYNNDGKGAGFNVPSLLGLQALPPYLHNGAAETLAAVLADVKHRTDNGRLPDRLSNAADQALVVKFLESVDVATVPVQPLGERPTQSSPIAINATDRLIWAVNPADDSVSVIRPDNNTRLAKIGVGDEPQSVALTPDNQYAYVANAAGNSVTVIKINDPAWGTFSATVEGQLSTGAEPWNVVCTPDGRRVFVANSGQDTITVIDTSTRTILGQVDLRNSLANDPDRGRHFQPRGLAVTADSSKLYVTRFLSFTKAGGRQGDDLGKEGLVAVLNIDTGSTNMSAYAPVRTIALAPQITGFKFPGLTNPPAPDTFAFPNQLQSVVIRGESAYVPNVAASPTGPLRFNLDTHAFVNVIGGVNSSSPVDFGALNLHLGARNPEAGKRRVFFANPWAIGFNNQVGEGFAYVASAASDLLVKVKVGADGRLDFTVDADTTRYIDLNDADNPATAGANAGKNPQGIAVTSDGTRAYVANFVSRNVSVVDLTTDTVMAVVSTSDLPASGSVGETNLVGAEMFFSSRGNFDSIPGTNSLRDRLSSEGWQSCASCHFKGLTDGVIWQFAAGPRKSVPLNGSFNPHQRSEQRVLNYSAIFDEIEDFEINIRNVSGPGPLAGGALDPNHGLLIGDNGDLNVAPSVLNAFARANADRAQVTVTLSGSTNKVPALTALREWVRIAVRTPNAPVAGLPNGPGTTELAQGRALFAQAGCAQCHGGGNWTVSLKDFISPPAAGELFTERTGTFTGNPVGAQYLNRFLRDIGSFNLGVPGQGNELGNNIGADEKAAAAVTGGALQPAQDALGIDYNNDGKGAGFNVPSLLGLQALPPYLHNGAAETLAAVLADVKHRTDNGRLPDRLSNAADQALVVKFLESVDVATVPVQPLGERPTQSSPIAINATDRLIWAVNPADDSVSVIRPDNNTRLAKIGVGDEPQSVALTPDNQYAYVANAAGNSVTVIKINDPAWGTFSATVEGQLSTGAEPWNVVCTPDGRRVFVANSGQDTITVIDTSTRTILGQVDLRNSLANDPDRGRHFQPRGLAVTADSSKLYVTRFLSFTKAGGRQGDDLGKEGVVAVLNIDTGSTNMSAYAPVRTIALAPQITGFKFPGLTNPPAPDTFAFPNQLQSVVIRGESAYVPNVAASPTGPLRFNLDTHAFVNVIGGVNSSSPVDFGALNLHLGARNPEAGKRRVFFANPWAIGFNNQVGEGFAYVASAASDLLVKVKVGADGRLDFTVDADTTRYIDLNDADNPATAGANAGKNPQGIAVTSDGTRAYVANFVSRNVSVVDLTTDTVMAVVSTSDLPASGSVGETNLVGAEMFFSSRGNFDSIPGTNSLRDRLSSEGWQSCASCHFKGLTDGVIWQFAAGPRKSVPLNGSFNPHQRSEQRVLNYSAIFDEIEDFEINIRNVSGPGPLAGGALDPNHGLLIGDNGDLNVAPSVLNAFARANADRAQVTVTLSGSTNKVPALTALREWVRNAVRTPSAPVAGLPNGPTAADLSAGRNLFLQAGCAQCHDGGNWTISLKDFISPPAGAEIFTERTGAFTGNPVGAQYLNRFLRDIGSFNLGVPGQGNELGNNIGADEKAAAAVTGGALQPAQDALGIDYNNDGKGAGFNVPSLLGLHQLPPFLHNGAAETLAQVVADVKHRTANGALPDVLADPLQQARLIKFLESIDVSVVPFVTVEAHSTGNELVLTFDSVAGVTYAVQAKDTLDSPWSSILKTAVGNGGTLEVSVPIDTAIRFIRLIEAP